MVTLTLQVSTLLVDCGDGGHTMYVFNDDDERLAFINERDKETFTLKNVEDCTGGYGEYENGYPGSDSITINLDKGIATLAERLSFHAGQ